VVAAVPGPQRIDAAAPEPLEPRPQRADRDRDLAAARMRVSMAGDLGDPRAQRWQPWSRAIFARGAPSSTVRATARLTTQAW
jgi:hypothetical protein